MHLGDVLVMELGEKTLLLIVLPILSNKMSYFFIIFFFRWTEKWLRRWRGVFCGHDTQVQPLGLSVLTGRCLDAVRDLRSAKCANYEGRSVLTSLQYDLECDAFNASKRTTANFSWTLLIFILLAPWL